MAQITYSQYLDQLSKCSHAKANSYPILSRRWKKKEDWKNGWNLMDHLMSVETILTVDQND